MKIQLVAVRDEIVLRDYREEIDWPDGVSFPVAGDSISTPEQAHLVVVSRWFTIGSEFGLSLEVRSRYPLKGEA
jgi:hypothetical protein